MRLEVLFSNMYGFLTKCKVKVAGYWPRSFSHVYLQCILKLDRNE